MAHLGYLVKPQEPTDEERRRLRERMAKIRAERDRRRDLYGPIDVAALVREARDEQGSNDQPGH